MLADAPALPGPRPRERPLGERGGEHVCWIAKDYALQLRGQAQRSHRQQAALSFGRRPFSLREGESNHYYWPPSVALTALLPVAGPDGDQIPPAESVKLV